MEQHGVNGNKLRDLQVGMTRVFAPEPLPNLLKCSIFLAGPTPREAGVQGWRVEALRILESLGFDGVVMLPEPRDGNWKHSYDDQLQWERSMREAADIIVFWVPRSMVPGPNGRASMPALTTNVEFGLDIPTGKVLYGRPHDASQCRYLDHIWQETTGRKPFEDMTALLSEAVEVLGQGHERVGEHAAIPLGIWRHEGIELWRKSLQTDGHVLKAAQSLLVWPPTPAGETPWLSVARVEVEVHGEGRTKNNEIVVSRPDASCVAALHDGTGGVRVLLVREFRSAGGIVLSLPGGSSPHGDSTPLDAAAEELREEAGLDIDCSRLVPLGSRHLCPSLLTHREHAYGLLLSDSETETLERSSASKQVHGANEDERITLLLVHVNQLASLDVGWGVLGVVHEAMRALCLGVKQMVIPGH